MSELTVPLSMYEEKVALVAQLQEQLTTYKKKYQSIVTPQVVRSWIERIENMCGSSFPYEPATYVDLTKNERSRKIREHKWLYMLQNKSDDSLLEPIVDLVEPTKYHKFCKDISNIYSIISNEIHGAKFENPDDLPKAYNLLAQKSLHHAIDIVMCAFQNETNN